ncbi:hypothetical protein JXJ21_01025 [candidate division KSB1 bacterium]|nr:hypothetical protein [candidate division KSB1 bacterium]
MNTQRFYRRVEIIKCFLLFGILVALILIFLKLPQIVTVTDLKTKQASLNDLPIVVVKDGRITLENKELNVKGEVTISNQPIEIRGQVSTSRW